MDNNIKVFNYQGINEVRVIEGQDGDPWFVAKDVCDVLEISKYRDAITKLDDDERCPVKVDTLQGEQMMTAISESGLYTLIMRSNKPEAKQFRKWVTAVVLPSIRKTGMYATPETAEKILNDPDVMIEILKAYKAEREKVAALTTQVEENRPKVVFAEAVDTSKDSILVGQLAKILRQNGIEVGQNRLFEWLRNNGFLMSCRGERWNMPRQEYIEMGLFEIKKSVVNNPDGSTKVNHTPKITGKGQIYFINKFLEGEFGIFNKR